MMVAEGEVEVEAKVLGNLGVVEVGQGVRLGLETVEED